MTCNVTKVLKQTSAVRKLMIKGSVTGDLYPRFRCNSFEFIYKGSGDFISKLFTLWKE